MRIASRVAAVLSIACLCFAVAGSAQAPDKAKSKTAARSAAKMPDKSFDINTATEKELISLPGVGAKTAKEIIAARPFKTIEDLKNVKGIGDKTFEKLKPHVVCNAAKK